MQYFIEIAGWLGAALILLAYGLLSSGKLDGRSKIYQLMNVSGAIGFILNSSWYGAIPSAALNVVWLFIGLAALYRNRTRS
jgi:hypothetical protein